MNSDEECESIMCPNCIKKRRLFLEYAIKRKFCDFKLNVLYKREDIILDLIDTNANIEKYKFTINTIKNILKSKDESINTTVNLFDKEIEKLKNKIEIETKQKDILNGQLDILYELIKEDEDELFNFDSDNDNDSYLAEDDNSDNNSDTPTEINNN